MGPKKSIKMKKKPWRGSNNNILSPNKLEKYTAMLVEKLTAKRYGLNNVFLQRIRSQQRVLSRRD